MNGDQDIISTVNKTAGADFREHWAGQVTATALRLPMTLEYYQAYKSALSGSKKENN
jgi:hypothetical protein